eukprot:scaffold5951_cov191-Pinguiococcus_pyrenoidosus.AAC.1
MGLLPRLRLVSCVTWGSPCVARAWALSSPMPLLPRLRLGRRAFGPDAVVPEVEAGELRDVGQALRRQGLGAFVSNAVAAEAEAGELRDVRQSLRCQGRRAFGSNGVAAEVEAGELG